MATQDHPSTDHTRSLFPDSDSTQWANADTGCAEKCTFIYTEVVNRPSLASQPSTIADARQNDHRSPFPNGYVRFLRIIHYRQTINMSDDVIRALDGMRIAVKA